MEKHEIPEDMVNNREEHKKSVIDYVIRLVDRNPKYENLILYSYITLLGDKLAGNWQISIPDRVGGNVYASFPKDFSKGINMYCYEDDKTVIPKEIAQRLVQVLQLDYYVTNIIRYLIIDNELVKLDM